MSRDDAHRTNGITRPELSAVAGELRAVGAAQTALAESLVVDLASTAMANGIDPSMLSRLQSFDRLAQEVEELAIVLDRLAKGVPVDDAVRVRLGDLSDRLTSRLWGRPVRPTGTATPQEATVDLF